MAAIGVRAFGPSVHPHNGPQYYACRAGDFFPSYFLLRFSANAKRALATNDVEALSIALRYLKFHYVSIGIGIIAGYFAYILLIAGILGFALLRTRIRPCEYLLGNVFA